MRRVHYRSIGGLAVVLGGVAAALFSGPTSAAAGGGVAGPISVRGGLAIRALASSDAAQVGTLTNKAKVNIVCQVTGGPVKGRVRTTDKWDRLTNGQYVSDAFVKRDTRFRVPACAPTVVAAPPTTSVYSLTGPVASFDQTRPPPVEWITPVAKTLIGGFRTVVRPEHDGVDLPHARNTPIVSAAAGTVITVRCNTSGPNCDVDGSPGTRGCGWYAEVAHKADVVTRYCHMIRQPEVTVGDTVTAGQVIGFVGSSGHSSGPHLHFEVHLGRLANRNNAVDPIPFMQMVGAPL
jgi:murein DD-endopeptidase MepM/ murein hydrolase activator NlpD